MRVKNGRRRLLTLAASVAALALSPQLDAVSSVPARWVLHQGTMKPLPVSAAVSASVKGEGVAKLNAEGTSLTAGDAGEADLTFRLLGLLPIRTVRVAVEPERRLIPGGQSVGVALNTAGLVVVGNSDLGGTASPARLAGIRSGDVIQRVDGTAVHDAAALSESLASGRPVQVELLRDGETVACSVTPARDSRDGLYKLGTWVRSSTAGVGTLTYYDPDTGGFGALGHAITDVDTGVVLPVGEGALYANRVVEITRSRKGCPGELTGDFFADARQEGTVTKNTEFGIFGEADGEMENPMYPDGLAMAARSEIHPGPATLLTTVDGETLGEYACEIERVTDRGAPATRSLVLRVTDQELLSATGGIVQGMSGSPILQDGRIVGAVTHVMVNDPAMGYGIMIEDMMAA